MNPPELKQATLVDGVIVIESDHHLSAMQADHLRAHVMKIWGKPVVVLDGGLRLVTMQDERLDRIEKKLDALTSALLEDDDGRPTHDLDGKEIVHPPRVEEVL